MSSDEDALDALKSAASSQNEPHHKGVRSVVSRGEGEKDALKSVPRPQNQPPHHKGACSVVSRGVGEKDTLKSATRPENIPRHKGARSVASWDEGEKDMLKSVASSENGPRKGTVDEIIESTRAQNNRRQSSAQDYFIEDYEINNDPKYLANKHCSLFLSSVLHYHRLCICIGHDPHTRHSHCRPENCY